MFFKYTIIHEIPDDELLECINERNDLIGNEAYTTLDGLDWVDLLDLLGLSFFEEEYLEVNDFEIEMA